jgi:hypothetical protein
MQDIGTERNLRKKNDLAVVTKKIDAEVVEASKESLDLREKIKVLTKAIDDTYWEVCELLYCVNRDAEYRAWGFATFKEYVEQDLGFTIRKAEYLINIWKKIVIELGGGDKKYLNKIKQIGWTKLKDIINYLTKDNVDEWKEKAKGMSVRELIEYKKETEQKEITDKLARAERGEKVDMDKLHTLNFKLYSDQYKTVLDACEMAGKVAKSDQRGHCLTMICQDYLMTNDLQEDRRANLMSHFKKFEAMAEVEIIAKDKSTGETIYNGIFEEAKAPKKSKKKAKKSGRRR